MKQVLLLVSKTEKRELLYSASSRGTSPLKPPNIFPIVYDRDNWTNANNPKPIGKGNRFCRKEIGAIHIIF